MANLLQFGEKIISRSDVNKNADVGVRCERIWQISGKKTSELEHLRERFCSHVFNMAQNNYVSRRIRMYYTSPEQSSHSCLLVQVVRYGNKISTSN